MVIRQNVQRGIPTRPILFVSVVLAVIALALSAASGLKSASSPALVQRAPAVVTTVMAPDAQERNQQILSSRGAQQSKSTYHPQ